MADLILAVLGRADAAPSVLEAAEHMQALMGSARLHVMAVLERVHLNALEAEALLMEADLILNRRREIEERGAALKSAFERWRQEADERATSAQWFEVEGTAATALADRGSRADLIVAAQPLEEDRASRLLFRAALFGTGRPVLMVPARVSGPIGRTVAIAWRDEKQAARAVIPALRWLSGSAKVHVLAGVHDPGQELPLPRIFTEHGIEAALHCLPLKPGPFGRTLLSKTHDLGADLLVMGAYARSPLREMVLGGVTKYMVDHADLPVLMRH